MSVRYFFSLRRYLFRAEKKNTFNSEVLPTEFIISLTPNGLPPYKLQLKIVAIVILLRNIKLNDWLCNGTRLKIEKIL